MVEDDFLQKIIEFRYKGDADAEEEESAGRGFTDSKSSASGCAPFAGQHTSSITSTWLGALLLNSPEVFAEVKAEQERLCPDPQSLNYKNLLEMDCMRRSVTEALRLYPPLVPDAQGEGRLQGGRTHGPQGRRRRRLQARLQPRPALVHDPTTFASRFADGRRGGSLRLAPVGHGEIQGMMMAFGGGSHMCSDAASATSRSRRSGRSSSAILTWR